MDQKLMSAFQKLVDANEPMPIKNVVISSAQAKLLEQLGLVNLSIVNTTKTPPKSPNYIAITDLGIAFTNLLSKNSSQSYIKSDKVFMQFYHIVTKTLHELNGLKEKSTNEPDLSEQKVYVAIKKNLTPSKNVTEIPIVVEEIKKSTDLSEKDIHTFLYRMFIENKIVLYGGLAFHGIALIADDGSYFYFISLIIS